MKENIRRLWDRMLKETQAEALSVLMTEFHLTSSTYIKQSWIWAGEIPEENQQRVVEIFQRLIKKQEDKTRKMI